MYVAGQKEMQEMDRYTIQQLGLPGVILMENAGAKVVDEVLANLSQKNSRILVLAGGGNNGGDGFVIARRLADLGMDALLYVLVKPERVKGDAKIHFDVYTKRGLPISFFHEKSLTDLEEEIKKSDMIIDAILGTGVNGQVREPISQVIAIVNKYAAEKPIISVDIPSGVSSDNGKVEGEAVKATKTVTFVFPKRGFFLNEGPQYIGEWKAVDISVPPIIVEKLGISMPRLVTESLAFAAVPKRPLNGHKGTFGHALIIGGSRQYTGAPVFTAKAVLHAGAGLATLAVPESIYPLAAGQSPESLFLPLPEENGHFAKKAAEELSTQISKFDTIAIGPGMSRFDGGEEWMANLIASLNDQPIVFDADALYLLRNNLDLVRRYKGDVILTPHPGEMARLVDKTVREVEADRLESARKFAKEFQVYLLLKGHRSIIAAPDGKLYINPHGHDALGKGGSGDVLTGLITSFLAQGASPLDSLISACYLHAKAGEEQAAELSHYGVMPFDIIDGVKKQLMRI